VVVAAASGSAPGGLVQLARDGRVATITLDRPAKLNALSDALVGGLSAAVAEVAVDESIEVVVLSGNGRAFCAGFDISRGEGSPVPAAGASKAEVEAYWRAHFEAATAMLLSIWDLPQPVVAKVHGYCLGGGMHLLLACDLSVAADDAVFGEPEIELGGVPSFPRLAMALTPCRAGEVLLLGERLGAARAYEIGLVNRVVPLGELDAVTDALAGRLAAMPAGALRRAKAVTHRAFELMGLREAVRFGAGLAAEALANPSQEAAELERLVAERGVGAALAAGGGGDRGEGEGP